MWDRYVVHCTLPPAKKNGEENDKSKKASSNLT